MEFVINSLILTAKDERLRILHYDKFNDVYFVINVKENRLPFAIDRTELCRLAESQEYKVINKSGEEFLYSEDNLSQAEKSKRDFAWGVVQFVFHNIGEKHLIFYSKYRQRAIERASSHFNVSRKTVKNYLLRYWKNGMNINAMLPNYRFCGAKGMERTSNTVKLGRPRANGSVGVNVDESIKKKFKIGLNRHYYTDKQNSLKIAYELTIRDFFTERQKDTNGKEISVIRDPTNVPTYNQFLYWFHKYNNPKKEITTRYGSRIYHQKHRPIVGNSTEDAGFGPGSLWQMDSTPLDVYCVSTTDRNLIVGKPLLHLVIDVYSRVIVGFSLSFESLNAYSGAMNALFNSMTSKRLFCERYQVNVGNAWDIACIPQRIFTDRGELENSQIENAIKNLGIAVLNSPSYRPETKAIIEQAFNQIMQQIVPHVDGAVVSGNRIRERGEQDYRLKANLTIFELTQILIKCILFYNNHHVIEGYSLDEGMMKAGIDKIPMEIWKYGVENIKGSLRTLPEEYIRMHLLETREALVTSQGLKFKKMFYINQYSLKNNWFEKAREKTWRIKIWFDPTDLSKVYAINEESRNFMEFKLLDHLIKYENKNITEIEVIEKEENIQVRDAKERELVEKVKLFQDIEAIVNSGREQTEKERNPNLSNAAKLNGIRVNQIRERDIQREWNKQIFEDVEFRQDVNDIEANDDLDLFRKIREGIND